MKTKRQDESKITQHGLDIGTYSVAMGAAEVGVWDLDLLTDTVRVCENLAAILGMPRQPQHLSGDEWRAKIPFEDLQHIENQIEITCSDDNHFNIQFRVRRAEGQFIWLKSKGKINKVSHGKMVHLVGVCFDITDQKHAEEALRESERWFRLLSDASPDAIFVCCSGKYVYANLAAARIMRIQHPRKLTRFGPEHFVDTITLQAAKEQAATQLEHDVKARPFTIPFRRLDGTDAIGEITYGRITWEGREALQILVRDVTEQRATEAKLRIMNERLKLVVEGSGEGIWDRNLISGKYELSGGMRDILGYPEHEMPKRGTDWENIIHPDDLPRVLSAFNACADQETPIYRCEYRIRTHDGIWKWVFSRGVVVSRDEHGKSTAMAGTITDVTAKREAEEIVWRHANLDPLTGIPNRRHFIDRLEAELRGNARSGTITALLFIDLDEFKQVNDLFGHGAGDLLLIEASKRIQRAIRNTNYLARLGGDEFTVLLTDLPDTDRIEFVCQEILASLSQPFSIALEHPYISASIGIALAPTDAATTDELLRKADAAMYNAKSAGKNQFSYFAQSMDDRAHRRLRVSMDLRNAITAGQLSLCYQPVIDLHNGHICKTEALLRWHHPKLGEIAPSVFVPIAEEAGLMTDIGNWVFREATSCTKRWSDLLGAPFKISLNKSPVQFRRRNMESHWLKHLKDINLPPSSIVVEITEGLLLNASDEVNKKLLEYRDAGIQVAIDDFGTGYSSMAYLKEFDIDYLKIDQSFVRGIPKNKGDCTIAETIIVMAHKLGQKVIAEGIETKEQADFLMKAGCDFGQGFYFSPPLPPDGIEAVLFKRYL